MANEKSNAALKQLTNCGLDGVAYYRRELVTRQLIEVLQQNETARRRRVLILDEATEDSLKSEALIYLLREFSGTEIFDLIYDTLSRRILRIIYQYRNKVDDFDDFFQNINLALLEKVLNSKTNQGDYAQVSFGQYVLGLAQNEYRKSGVREKRNAVTDSTDAAVEEQPKIEIEATETTIEKKLLIREAINQLPENVREACILHHLKGWKIKSNDETEPTLTKYFQKSDRQIRNWLAEAKRILEEWKGVLR